MPDLERESKKPQVFISYASTDRVAAQTILEGLRSRHLNLWLDTYEIHPGEPWTTSIRSAISASAYFLLLLSQHSISSHWVSDETETALQELRMRGITFLPLLLDNCPIPRALAQYQSFDMSSGIDENLDKLAEALQSILKINFEKLSPQSFEQLVMDLLQKLGFVHLPVPLESRDSGIDAIVEFQQRDPFGVETHEVYAVETKFYRDDRPGLQALNQLAGYAKSNPNVNQALLVTDGNLSSVAWDWVSHASKAIGVPIRVIEGTELKRLLLQNTELVSKYFANNLIGAS